MLARRALEEALHDLWLARAPGLELASARAQLSCLPDYLGDPGLAAEIVFTWSALSGVCHHHAYELASTAPEIERRLDAVDRLVSKLARGHGDPAAQPFSVRISASRPTAPERSTDQPPLSS